MQTKNEYYMSIAIKEAKKGRGFTKTNPLVGAVITKDDKILSTGYHAKFGGDHAEINAIKNAPKNDLEGATMYVTLEPCSEYAKTPPCTEAIIKNKIKRVVIGCFDPNPAHHKKAINILKNHDIDIQVGVLKKQCKKLLKSFIINISQKRPYIILKMAMTLDGKIAIKPGESTRITGKRSRELVHKIRKRVDAVMVGKNTVLVDDPELTVRHIKTTRQPDKIVFDSNLELSLNHKIFTKSKKERIFVITKKAIGCEAKNKYMKHGVEVISSDGENKIKSALNQLHNLNIGTILLEGGSKLATSFLKEKLVDEVLFFYTPKMIGSHAVPVIGGLKSRVFREDICKTTIAVPDIWKDLALGESIAVNGVCLTVTGFTTDSFFADISIITLQDTTIKSLKIGANLNLERCMKVGERFGGHIVQGHVDGVGKIISTIKKGANLLIKISTEQKLQKLIANKASIAIDGVSLTVQQLGHRSFTVLIVPHSAKNTDLSSLRVGDIVNIEIDVLAKYVHHFSKKS